jgi:hypothetical protein
MAECRTCVAAAAQRHYVMSHLHTRRLRLVPATAETTALELSGHGRLGVVLGCTVPVDWPPDDLRDALPMFEAVLRDRPEKAVGAGILALDPQDVSCAAG